MSSAAVSLPESASSHFNFSSLLNKRSLCKWMFGCGLCLIPGLGWTPPPLCGRSLSMSFSMEDSKIFWTKGVVDY